MSATIIDIADAVVTRLNAQTFGQEFTATRSMLPRFDLKDLDVLRVTVVPAGLQEERNSRESKRRDYEIHVGIQKRIDDTSDANIAAMVELVEEIADDLDGLTFATPRATCIGAETVVLYDPAILDQRRAFMSVLSLTWRLYT
jgi:hypothetical protein